MTYVTPFTTAIFASYKPNKNSVSFSKIIDCAENHLHSIVVIVLTETLLVQKLFLDFRQELFRKTEMVVRHYLFYIIGSLT